MRTWKAAERALRKETSLTVRWRRAAQPLPLVLAAGGARPDVVLALGGVNPDDPMDTVADLATLAAALRPSRVLVGLAVPDTERARAGLLVVCDMTAVADGLVEVTRVWRWRRVGPVVWWPRVELRRWSDPTNLLAGVAAAVLKRRGRRHSPEVVHELRRHLLAAGHRVRLAR